ncbi:ATP-binding cassette sub- G member 2, partial [Cladochytrium tenue]
PRDPRIWRKMAAFVEQDDALHTQLTVRETIEYAARLRLPADLRRDEKLAVADAMLRNLRLARCADTRIGDADVRGVSGGERKRASIARELVGCPDIVFLDEPTSGLDSASAHAVVSTVRRDARHAGRIVVATLHQPSWALLSLFDKVVLLAAGGVVFLGPPSLAVQHFAALGLPAPPNQNPADFFMDLLTVDVSKGERVAQRDLDRIDRLKKSFRYAPADTYASAAAVTSTSVAIADHIDPVVQGSFSVDSGGASTLSIGWSVKDSDGDASGGGDSRLATEGGNAAVTAAAVAATAGPATSTLDLKLSRWSNPWMTEFGVLLERCALEMSRDRAYLVAGLARSIVVFILIGFSYFQLQRNQRGINDRVGILFFWPINLIFTTITPLVLIFPMERTIMRRERAAAAYRVSTFFLAKLLTTAAVTTVFSLVGSVPIYFMLGLRLGDDWAPHFFKFILVQWLESLTATSVAFLVGAAVRTQKVAQVAGPLATVVFLLYGGGLTNFDDIGYPFRLLQWVSPVSYAFRANMINEFSGLTFSCDGAASAASCTSDGYAVLDFYSVSNLSFGACIGALLALFFGYAACAYLVLLRLHKPASAKRVK